MTEEEMLLKHYFLKLTKTAFFTSITYITFIKRIEVDSIIKKEFVDVNWIKILYEEIIK